MGFVLCAFMMTVLHRDDKT